MFSKILMNIFQSVSHKIRLLKEVFQLGITKTWSDDLLHHQESMKINPSYLCAAYRVHRRSSVTFSKMAKVYLLYGVFWFSKYPWVWCFYIFCPNILVTKWTFHSNQIPSEFPRVFCEEIWLSWRSYQRQKHFVVSPPLLGAKVRTGRKALGFNPPFSVKTGVCRQRHVLFNTPKTVMKDKAVCVHAAIAS